MNVRTNIALDEQLVEEAFRCAGVRTRRELVDLALREFVENHERRDMRSCVTRSNSNPATITSGCGKAPSLVPGGHVGLERLFRRSGDRDRRALCGGAGSWLPVRDHGRHLSRGLARRIFGGRVRSVVRVPGNETLLSPARPCRQLRGNGAILVLLITCSVPSGGYNRQKRHRLPDRPHRHRT
jgi:hypothetical protein